MLSEMKLMPDQWDEDIFGEDEPQEDAPKEAEKRTLEQLLDMARKSAMDIEGFDIDLAQLGVDLRSKIDNIVEYLDYCKARAESLQKRAQEFQRKANAFENRAKNLREYVAHQIALDVELQFAETGMREEKPRICGDSFEFLLQYSTRAEPVMEANPDIYLKVGMQFIRRSYAWDKIALRKALESNNEWKLKNNEPLSKYVALKKHPFIKIQPK